MSKNKTQNENDLLKVFKQLKKITTPTKINVEGLLAKHEIVNVAKTSTFIRHHFLLSEKAGYYRWNPEKEIPTSMKDVMVNAINYFVKSSPSPAPIVEIKPVQNKTNKLDVLMYQKIFEYLKGCKTFTRIRLNDLLREHKAPYYATASKPIIEDFLEAGEQHHFYRWRDPKVEIPNINDYLKRIVESTNNLPSVKNKYKGKTQPTIKPKTIIATSEQKMEDNLKTLIQMLQNASPVEAETIINKNDMVDGKIKMELRRMYHDNTLVKRTLSDIVDSLLSSQPIKNVDITPVPVITKPIDEFDLKIQLMIKHTILGYYQKGIESLLMDTKTKARQYGIELTDEELLQPITQTEISH